MLKSMTGFGKVELSLPDKNVIIEIRSMNSKLSDLSIKVPYIYRGYESEIRKIVTDRLERGKIELSIFIDNKEGNLSANLNESAIKSYYLQLKKLENELGIPVKDNALPAILGLPEVIKSDKTEADENEWLMLRESLTEAVNDLDNFRIQEGEMIRLEMEQYISSILDKLNDISHHENDRLEKIKEKLRTQLEKLFLPGDYDKNRFEQEIIYYLEKLDFSEEKTRLENHCTFFLETCNAEGSNGKKLGFIAQEIGREINTLGSKASDSEIQKLVVLMKDDLEKIKEQLFNIL